MTLDILLSYIYRPHQPAMMYQVLLLSVALCHASQDEAEGRSTSSPAAGGRPWPALRKRQLPWRWATHITTSTRWVLLSTAIAPPGFVVDGQHGGDDGEGVQATLAFEGCICTGTAAQGMILLKKDFLLAW